ncbi:putative long chain acyl-CoA synthetase 8-like isoform X1 [Capsicum annuum]|nr:putative long chain acyl-CoA synthetase 8-like isoform X1 [Capsicum annuum]KAF3661446.1 putative long chain acyl-CoA synthetase 8-like isoform X1 [Capsicum annuum]
MLCSVSPHYFEMDMFAHIFQGSNLAAAGSDSSSKKLWDITQWQLIDTLSIPRQRKAIALHAGPHLVFSPSHHDLGILFSESNDGHVHLYDAEEKTLLTSLSGHASWVLSVDVSPDGEAIATSSSDETVNLWYLKLRAATQTLTNHTDQVWSVTFGPPLRTNVKSCMLASVSNNKSISFYQYS